MVTSSITSFSASMSLKHTGKEGKLGTAEQGEKNTYPAPPFPPPQQEGIFLPFNLINRKLWSPERGWSLGGGRKRLLPSPAQTWQAVQARQAKTNMGSHML